MSNENNKVDYMASINKARGRRKRPPYGLYAAIAIGCACLLGGTWFGIRTLLNKTYDETIVTENQMETAADTDTVTAMTIEDGDPKTIARMEEIQSIIDKYSNLGIIQVSGYLNIRENPESGEKVVGKLMDGSACDIVEELDGWYKISSGGIEGYISSDYVLTGDAAKEAALTLVTDRAVVKTNNLNIRKEPSKEAEVVGQCLEGERYEILSEVDGWYEIPGGYISADYAEREFSFNEARTLDLRAMVLNYYNNPGVSNVSNYLNIRQKPGTSEKIIGKLPSHAGCEILEELDGWYKIRSGKLTGYVSSDYILTGDAARNAAMEHAELMAIVSTDVLNARTEPSTDAKIWTQISNNERYHVVEQLDGWVKIEFDEGSEDGGTVTAYVSSEYVDVRYALDEAIKFSPAEENASFRSKVVNYALKWLGNPYVWGGTSLTRGADCSGFTLSVFKNFGISLPHYSGSQAQMGTAVKSSNMRPGDLIFYGNSSGTINHVAMYIGNGQVVHAASKKSGIKISSWNYRKPLKIRDIIGNRK